MTTTKTIAGRVPFIELSTFSGRTAGEVWISDRCGAALNRIKGNWDGRVLCDDHYWSNREAAQVYIDEHADKPDQRERPTSRDPWYAVYVIGSIPEDEPIAIFEYADMATRFGMQNYPERFKVEPINWHKATVEGEVVTP